MGLHVNTSMANKQCVFWKQSVFSLLVFIAAVSAYWSLRGTISDKESSVLAFLIALFVFQPSLTIFVEFGLVWLFSVYSLYQRGLP